MRESGSRNPKQKACEFIKFVSDDGLDVGSTHRLEFKCYQRTHQVKPIRYLLTNQFRQNNQQSISNASHNHVGAETVLDMNQSFQFIVANNLNGIESQLNSPENNTKRKYFEQHRCANRQMLLLPCHRQRGQCERAIVEC